jgi:hypothetical protein
MQQNNAGMNNLGNEDFFNNLTVIYLSSADMA